ncbi:MAG: methyltransferase domain-containing protein [Bryobacterales bacterium]|nr:methyltransferase domain-containing protein [Bryobacterales bacterium]
MKRMEQVMHVDTGCRAEKVDVSRQPGHWVLAALGKRVLRPGGLELTEQLIEGLSPNAEDDVVEFAPGLGVTAQMVLNRNPRSYIGIERESKVAGQLANRFAAANTRFLNASAEATCLEDGCAGVVYGEAMLSMQTPEQKRRILTEAFRILRPGGRYGIHELALTPNDVEDRVRKAIEREMSLNIHVGVRPLTTSEWRKSLEKAGFRVTWEQRAPMHLLEPRRVIADEGIMGAARMVFNLLRKPAARRRVLSMRAMFRRYSSQLSAVALVAVKPAE